MPCRNIQDGMRNQQTNLRYGANATGVQPKLSTAAASENGMTVMPSMASDTLKKSHALGNNAKRLDING
jgi:hypothetical protein